MLYELLVGVPPFYTDNIRALYNSIQKAKLQIPSVISREARDLLHKMLNKKPRERITISQMKTHPFFNGINWKLLAERKVTPPPLSRLEEQDDTELNSTIEQFNAAGAEASFLSNVPDANQANLLKDKDYSENNKNLNRVK